MRVLVTGASGFIGRPLCRLLQARGHAVICVSRETGSSQHINVGDIGPETDWSRAFNVSEGQSRQLDTIVHLAARVHVMKEAVADPLTEFRIVNVDGTLNLARQAVAAGVKRFVYVSSIKVNGESTAMGRPFRADDVPAPQDDYAISKHEAEVGLRKLAQESGLDVVIVRPPLVYGPEVKGNFADLLRWVRGGIPLPLGAIKNRRSLVALDNLVDFIALCADREMSPCAANEVFLISDGENLSTPELLRKVAAAYGARLRLISIPAGWLRMCAKFLGKSAEAGRLLDSLVVDSTKATTLLGWRPVTSMEEQLRKIADDVAYS